MSGGEETEEKAVVQTNGADERSAVEAMEREDEGDEVDFA